MKTFLTADWHLGEDRFEIMARPFEDVQQHIDTLVERHNKKVGPDDLVYVNGDVLYQKANPDDFLHQIARFHGRKILIRGNHDRPFTDEQFAPYFEKIVPEGEGVETEVAGIPCYITHYPSLAKVDRYNLVGHIHSAWKIQLNSLNVGVDVNHFFPVDESQVAFFLEAVKNFYDLDVWTAYTPANHDHFKDRGKKSYYFVPGSPDGSKDSPK